MDLEGDDAQKEIGVQEMIKALIVQGEFELGARISEDQLGERFGIGKARVRRVLAHLAAIGIVQVRPRIGTFFFKLSEADFEQLNFARALLECAAVRSAMSADPHRCVAAMRENVQQAAALDLRDNYRRAYRELDREFHKLPFRYAGNRYLADAYETMDIKIWAMRSLLTFPDSHFSASLDAHRAVVELLGTGDVEAACQRLQQHIQKSFSQRERSLLGDSTDSDPLTFEHRKGCP
jgi:DNA-binding GntR family transcriptional regulator